MTPKQLAAKFVLDYWEMLIVPLSIWLYHSWMSRKIKIIIGSSTDETPKTDQCERLLEIVATQTRILESLGDSIKKMDADIQAHYSLSRSMKEEDVRVRDKFTACLEKISEGTDAMVSMFKEFRAFERGRDAAARA